MARRPLYALLIGAAATTAGCAGLAEDVATHVIARDFKAVDQEVAVFKADLALFRECLKQRGGSCQGTDTTALPHSSQDAASQPVTPVKPGSSQVLADSVRQLPAGHPAKDAHAVLSHPVVRQAAALHNHLRGHGGVDVPGVSIETGRTSGGAPASTVTMDLKVGQGEQLHHSLLGSIGGTAWDSLHKHCLTALEKHQTDAELAADCRRAAFIRGYLEAYFRHGELLEVDVQLAGAIRALDHGAAEIEAKIQSLQSDIAQLGRAVAADKRRMLTDVSTDAGNVGTEVRKLLGKVQTDLTRHFGAVAGDVFSALSRLGTEVETRTQQLATAAAAKAEADVNRLVDDVDNLLGQIDTELGKLRTRVGAVDQRLVDRIDDELQKADSKLSNVFKVSNAGFVSRDATFSARLPTIEVTLDPTAQRLVTFKDVDSGQVLTGESELGDLGVATDTSGVGTGAAIGAELLRVFLEAVFDAHEGLPAVYPANVDSLKPTGLTLGDHSLPTFRAPMGDVDARDLTRMTTLNDRIATQTRVILGRVIEGIGPFSLNNKALESFLVELVATSVRKAAEKATWCFYACDLDVDLERLRADFETAAKAAARAAAEKLEAEAQRLGEKAKAEAEARLKAAEQRAEAGARHQAEQVKLRLNLSR